MVIHDGVEYSDRSGTIGSPTYFGQWKNITDWQNVFARTQWTDRELDDDLEQFGCVASYPPPPHLYPFFSVVLCPLFGTS